MKLLDIVARDAVETGQVVQIVLADEEGLVLENVGDRFPPDELIAALMGAGSGIQRIRDMLRVGPISELSVRLEEERLTLAGRFFRTDDEDFLLIMVVPPASGYKVLSTQIVRAFAGVRSGSDESKSFSGSMLDVDFLEYLQVMMLSGKSGVVEVSSCEGAVCRVYLDNGKVVHAVSGDLEGEDALYRCMRFTGGRFSNIPECEPDRKTIDKPGEFLLLECARIRDEAKS